MIRFLAAALGCLAACVVSLGAVQAPSIGRLAGTWTMNLAKSSFEGTSGPQSLTMRIEDQGDGLILMWSEAVMSNGSRNTNESAFKCDGRAYPITLRQDEQKVQLSLVCSVTSAGAYELQLDNEDGEALQNTVRTLADDGRSMTDIVTAIMPDGQPLRVVAVFEKQ
jgi:hypothetical protein